MQLINQRLHHLARDEQRIAFIVFAIVRDATRSSYIAQVGLFVLTLWTLFYTVIPLYKTAALEEQIARRETELKATEQKLAEANAALREANEKAYRRSRAELLWNLNFHAGASCSGLLRPSETPELLNDMFSGARKSRPKRPLLDINVADCLAAELEKTNADTVLRAEDLVFLRAAVTQVAISLERQRADATAAMQKMETKSTQELYAFASKDPFAQQVDALLEKAYPQLHTDPRFEHASAVQDAQMKIAQDFEEQVRVEIRKLQNIAWPES